MFAKTVTDMVDYVFGVGVSGRRPSKSADPGGQGGVRGLEGVRIQGSTLFEGIRGEGAEGGLRSKTAHPGVSILLPWAIDPLLWRSRDRFAGIPGRRSLQGDTLRRIGDDFGTQKWT